MDELFDAHFQEGRKRFTYHLNAEQSASMYQGIGHYLATTQAAAGFDVVFDKGQSSERTFKLDATDTFTLYRRLGIYLQKRYPGSESLLHLREIVT